MSNFDKALTPNEFTAKYGEILAMGLWGARKVGSATTKKHYVWFDHVTGEYVVEAR